MNQNKIVIINGKEYILKNENIWIKILYAFIICILLNFVGSIFVLYRAFYNFFKNKLKVYRYTQEPITKTFNKKKAKNKKLRKQQKLKNNQLTEYRTVEYIEYIPIDELNKKKTKIKAVGYFFISISFYIFSYFYLKYSFR